LSTPDNEQPQYYAAIDLGSNSFHLVIVRDLQGDLQTLFKYKERVRLASGLDNKNVLDQEAIERGVEVLRLFAEQLKPFPDCHVFAVATHTLRQAVNRRHFLEAASQVFPYPIDIISGQEEARLIYQGVAHDEQLDGNTLVIDIGGGSTEIVIGKGTDIQIARSHQMGCVSFTQQFFQDSPNKADYKRAKLAARQRLERFEEIFRRIGWKHVRLSSGTAQAITSAATYLDENFNGLTRDHISLIRKTLFSDPEHPIFTEVTAERVGVLAGGLAILEAIFDALNIESAGFSSSALREGILYEALETDEQLSIRDRSCQSLMQRYHVDQAQAELVNQTTTVLWSSARASWSLPPKTLKFLSYAAQLHEVGLNINAAGLHKHSAYIVANSTLPGFSFEQQQLVAGLIRQHRKRLRDDLLVDLQLADESLQKRLIFILRLAVIWHLNRHPNPPPWVDIQWLDNGANIVMNEAFAEEYPLLVADLSREAALLEESPEWPSMKVEVLP
jgi:exopolyphosphatase/guanosine-5'-triphosphate,3'-diphosphate pyrophosphatase